MPGWFSRTTEAEGNKAEVKDPILPETQTRSDEHQSASPDLKAELKARLPSPTHLLPPPHRRRMLHLYACS